MNYGYISPRVSNLDFKYIRKYLRNVALSGEVIPYINLTHEDKCFRLLKELAESNGFIYRKKCEFYGSRQIILVSGSVGEHKDEGMGLVLSWLIHQEPIRGKRVLSDSCYLQTRKGEHELKLGDVFLFNATHYHAWISNFDCALVQITVSKQKKIS